jgi:fatty-acyl-CoA synthase
VTALLAATTIGGMLLSAVGRFERRPALRVGDVTWTYGDWLARSERVMTVLVARGIRPGDRVAVLAADGPPALAGYLGVWLAGGVAVHVNARLAGPEIEHILADADVAALLHTAGLTPPAAAPPLVECIDELVGIGPAQVDTGGPVFPDPESPAIIGYTSGTSGRPKGAVVSHRVLTTCCRVAPFHTRMTAGGALAFTGSVSFVGTLWGQVLPHLYLGAVVRFFPGHDLDTWFAAMRADRSTFTYVPTPMIAQFAERLQQEPDVLDHLCTVMHAGSTVPEKHVQAIVAASRGRYLDTYGSTEMVGSVTATGPDTYSARSGAERPFATAGPVLPAARVWIEREDGSRADPGELGTVMVQSDTLFDGYWRDPDKTAAVLDDDTFDTGDLGHIDASGHLYLSDRRTDLILSGGMNVYPAEVERVILELPEVGAVAVFAVPHPQWGRGVAAAVVAQPGASVTRERVLTACRHGLAGYKKPTEVLVLDELPYNVGRKVDRAELLRIRDRLAEEPFSN